MRVLKVFECKDYPKDDVIKKCILNYHGVDNNSFVSFFMGHPEYLGSDISDYDEKYATDTQEWIDDNEDFGKIYHFLKEMGCVDFETVILEHSW